MGGRLEGSRSPGRKNALTILSDSRTGSDSGEQGWKSGKGALVTLADLRCAAFGAEASAGIGAAIGAGATGPPETAAIAGTSEAAGTPAAKPFAAKKPQTSQEIAVILKRTG